MAQLSRHTPRRDAGPPPSSAVLAACLILAGCLGPPQTASSPRSPEALRSPISTPSATTGQTAATGAPPSSADPPDPAPLTSQALRDAIGVTAIRAHLEELQHIADANGGTRAAGTPGFDASVEYVAGRLEDAGYGVERQAFPFGDGTNINLLAELPGVPGGEVLMLGAHLDSAPAGPGINDNGTGTMTLLGLAELLPAFARPLRTVRFAFWGAEEPGRIGSAAYIAALRPDQLAPLTAYLNFEMLGSPNYIRFVHDDAAGATGSDAITDLFAAYFVSVGLTWEPIDLSGKSDHAAFAQAGIPTGGLFGGGREPKTDAQAAAFGGTAGAPADPCSDAACDTIANVTDVALNQMADAVAHALVVLAEPDRGH